MISRVWRVSVGLVASLTVATVCLAADAPGGGPGQGGIGGQIGGSTYALDRAFSKQWFGEYSNGSGPRLAFAAHWRYEMSKRWRAQLGTGFSWTGYTDKHSQLGVPNYPIPFTDPNFPNDKDKSHFLTLMLPVSLQLQYVGRHGSWQYHVGAGPGVYRVWVENHRKVLKDPISLKLHRGLYPGMSGELGIERFLKALPNVSLEATAQSNLALAQRHEQFPSGLDSNVMATEFRIGGNYYFTPGPRKAPAAAPKRP